jgi:hypothetical protein
MASLTFAVNDKSLHIDWATIRCCTTTFRIDLQILDKPKNSEGLNKSLFYPSVDEAEIFYNIDTKSIRQLDILSTHKKISMRGKELKHGTLLASTELHGSRGSIHNPMNGSNKPVLYYTGWKGFPVLNTLTFWAHS